MMSVSSIQGRCAFVEFVGRLCGFEGDEVLRIRSCVTEHHEDERVLRLVHGAVVQSGPRVRRVDGIRLLHSASAFAQRPRHHARSVDVLQPFVVWVGILVVAGVPGLFSEVGAFTVNDRFKTKHTSQVSIVTLQETGRY